jgi:hypothetical protein
MKSILNEQHQNHFVVGSVVLLGIAVVRGVKAARQKDPTKN